MIVTIIGAGNAGYSHACKLVENGHKVRLVKTSHAMHDESFNEVIKNQGIYAIDDINNGRKFFAKLDMVTRDLKEAMLGADIIFVLTQSLQHEDLAKKVSPFIEDGQMVIVAPGYMGSVYFRNKCLAKDVIFAEGESLPYDARIVENGVVNILFENIRNPLGFMPVSRKEEGLKKARKLLNKFYARENILESALHNPNLIVHTVGTIFSAARIEYSNGEFWMYREAFTPSTWNLVNDLDGEKMAILKLFGLPIQTFADSFQFRTYVDLETDPFTAFKNYAYHGSPKGPTLVNHRYIYEDVPMGLCLMSSIGKKFNIPTPICDSLINISGSLLQKDFWSEGRNLEKLGLENMTKDEIIELIIK